MDQHVTAPFSGCSKHLVDLDIINASYISRMRVPVTSTIVKYLNNRRSHDTRHETDFSIYHLTLVLTFYKKFKQKLKHL